MKKALPIEKWASLVIVRFIYDNLPFKIINKSEFFISIDYKNLTVLISKPRQNYNIVFFKSTKYNKWVYTIDMEGHEKVKILENDISRVKEDLKKIIKNFIKSTKTKK